LGKFAGLQGNLFSLMGLDDAYRPFEQDGG
jgi:hypothetical protein